MEILRSSITPFMMSLKYDQIVNGVCHIFDQVHLFT